MPKTPEEKLAALACEGACASKQWADIPDLWHHPPRQLSRWKHAPAGSGGGTNDKNNTTDDALPCPESAPAPGSLW